MYHEFVLTSKNYIRTVTEIRPEWLFEIAPDYFDLNELKNGEAKRKLERVYRRVREWSLILNISHLKFINLLIKINLRNFILYFHFEKMSSIILETFSLTGILVENIYLTMFKKIDKTAFVEMSFSLLKNSFLKSFFSCYNSTVKSVKISL